MFSSGFLYKSQTKPSFPSRPLHCHFIASFQRGVTIQCFPTRRQRHLQKHDTKIWYCASLFHMSGPPGQTETCTGIFKLAQNGIKKPSPSQVGTTNTPVLSSLLPTNLTSFNMLLVIASQRNWKSIFRFFDIQSITELLLICRELLMKEQQVIWGKWELILVTRAHETMGTMASCSTLAFFPFRGLLRFEVQNWKTGCFSGVL